MRNANYLNISSLFAQQVNREDTEYKIQNTKYKIQNTKQKNTEKTEKTKKIKIKWKLHFYYRFCFFHTSKKLE